MIKTIIFDMDGVLVDTPKFTWEVHNKLLKELGKRVPNSEIPKYLGKRLEDQIDLFEKNLGIKIDKNVYKEKFLLEKEHELERIQKSPSLVKLIKSLKSRKLKLAVATSSSEVRARHLLNHVGIADLFDVFTTAEDVKLGKPNPEVFLKTAEKMGVLPSECIVVEDALNGIEATKKAHMTAVALETTFLKREAFKDADYVISSLNELPQLLSKILPE